MIRSFKNLSVSIAAVNVSWGHVQNLPKSFELKSVQLLHDRFWEMHYLEAVHKFRTNDRVEHGELEAGWTIRLPPEEIQPIEYSKT